MGYYNFFQQSNWRWRRRGIIYLLFFFAFSENNDYCYNQ